MNVSKTEVLNFLPEDELIGEEDELKTFLENYTDELYDLIGKDPFTDPLNENEGKVIQELQELEMKERIEVINQFYKTCLKKQGYEQGKRNTNGEELEVDDIESFSGIRKKLDAGVKNNEKKHLRYKTAELFTEKYNFAYMKERGVLYIYNSDNGLYEKGGEQKLKKMIRKIWEGDATTHDVNEIINIIKDTNQYSMDDFNQNNDLIHLKNCIYNTKKHETMEHDPEILATVGINVEYDPDAQLFNSNDEPVSEIGEFLDTVLKDDQKKVVQEIVGLCSIKDYPAQKAFFLYGDGANGKTTLMNLIKNMIGPENVSSRSLIDLIKNQFAPADLYGKMANLSGEVASSKITSTDMFKRLTGGDPVSAELKHTTIDGENSFTFHNNATLFFVQNDFPEVDDDSYAFYRRMIPLKFDYKIPENKQVDGFAEKISTSEELSALFNWAMEGLRRYQERGHLSYSASVEEVRNEILGKMDSMKAFISSEHVGFHPDAYVSKDVFKKEYSDYCHRNEYQAKSKTKIGKNLPSKDNRITASHTDIDGKDTKIWRGIYLKNVNHEGKPDEVKTKKEQVEEEKGTLSSYSDGVVHDFDSQKDRVQYIKNNIDDGIKHDDLLELVKEEEVYDDPVETKLMNDLELMVSNEEIMERDGYYEVI